MSQVTLNLQPSRISALIAKESCTADQIVLDAGSEADFERDSTKFTHVEWRSIAEVIQYLGALLRYKDSNGAADAVSWEFRDSDGNAVEDKGRNVFDVLFTAHRRSVGDESSNARRAERVSVNYRGDVYALNALSARPRDRSLEVLSMVNELISIAKISGSLPVSQPVQVLP